MHLLTSMILRAASSRTAGSRHTFFCHEMLRYGALWKPAGPDHEGTYVDLSSIQLIPCFDTASRPLLIRCSVSRSNFHLRGCVSPTLATRCLYLSVPPWKPACLQPTASSSHDLPWLYNLQARNFADRPAVLSGRRQWFTHDAVVEYAVPGSRIRRL